MKKTLQVLFGFLALGCIASGATIQFTSGGDLAAAVADETCDRIELGDGTYEVSAQISVSRALTIVGVNGRDKVTVRHASGSSSRIFNLNHAQAVVQGVTITGGSGASGSGVNIGSSGGQVLACRVTGNTTGMNQGGAINIGGANGFVARTIIDNNVNNNGYSYSGSGIRMSAGHVESCLIYGNTNSGTSRGATGCYSGGVHLSGGTMSNCTVTANSGRNTGGVSVESSGKVVNCIIYGNTKTSGTSTANGVPECNLTSAYTGCMTTDPIFLNPAANDYHISTYSPARDAGTGLDLSASTDLDGNPRVAGTAIDVGCYENPGFDEWIYVVGSPEDYATITPAYGVRAGLAANGELLCHAPAAWTNEAVTRRAIHTGWEVRDWNGTVVATAPAGDYTYVHSGRLATLVCKWDAECLVTASAGTGGSIDIASQWIGFGQNATVEATPSPSLPGCVFWKWTGDVPAGHENDNPLTLAADAPKSLAAVFSARTNYVASAENPCATPAFPYGSRETAANSLPDAVAVAMDGGVVLCQAGTHNLSAPLPIEAPVSIVGEGGYQAVTVRQTMSKGNARQVLKPNHPNAILRGLTITGGYVYNSGNNGAGVCFGAAGGQVLQCRVTGNESSMNSSGGGIYMASDKAVVSHTIIDANRNGNNNASSSTGISMSAGHVDNCLIIDNTMNGSARSYNLSGGIGASGGTVSNCTISANSGRGAGGVNASGTAKIVNCVICGNTRSSYSSLVTGDPEWMGTADCYVNCLFPIGVTVPNDSCFQGDPHFAGEGDYHLGRGSAAHENAVAPGIWTASDTDLDGMPRVSGGRLDLGCYAYITQGFDCTIGASSWRVPADSTVNFRAIIDNSLDPSDYSFAWTITNTTGRITLSSSVQNPALSFPSAGRYSIRLVVTAVPSGDTVFEEDRLGEFVVTAPLAYVRAGNAGAEYPYDTVATAATNVIDAFTDLTEGGILDLGEGTFDIPHHLELTAPYTIRGKGRDVTTLRAKPALGVSRVLVLNHPDACVSNITITGGVVNDQIGNGAGVYISTLGGRVINCRVTGNRAGMNCSGGGIAMASDNAVVSRTIIDNNANDNNYASPGAGLHMSAGHVDNCLIVSNTMSGTSRAYNVVAGLNASGGTVTNCTVSANSGRGAGGVNASGSAKIVNCVICGNTRNSYHSLVDGDPEWMGTASCYVNCLVPVGVTAPNESCFVGDPHFAGEGDFRPGVGSAAHEYAVAPGGWTAADLDLDGNPRVSGGLLDLGCYAYVSQGFGCTIDISALRVPVGSSVTFRALVDESVDTSAYRFGWTITNTTGRIVLSSAEQNPTLAFPSAGRYSIRLVVTAATTGDIVFEDEKPAELLVAPAIAYVRAGNTGAEYPYDTVATASPNVVDAFADLIGGSVLDIGEGTFEIPVQLQLLEALTVRGKGMDTTVLRVSPASGVTSRVILLNHPDACVSNLTVTGGRVSGSDGLNGAGISIGLSGGTVEGCRITGNTTALNGHGGGAYINSSHGILRRCIVNGNTITWTGGRAGGGIHVTAGTVENCLVFSNSLAYTSQWGVNYSATGGGIYASGSDVVVRNCTVFGNYARVVPGIYASGGATVVNCISDDNTVWDETEVPQCNWGGTALGFQNCLFGDVNWLDSSAKSPNSSCLVGDPRFKDVASLNFHLAKDSPAIGEGLYAAWMDASRDLDGNARVKHYKHGVGDVDIGCYETPWRKGGTVIVLR